MGVNGQLIEGSLVISASNIHTVDLSSSKPTVFAFYAISSELHDHMVKKGGVELVLR